MQHQHAVDGVELEANLGRDEASVAAVEVPEPPREVAQAVRCGERWIAFTHDWARSAVEKVELSAVPGAPDWLAGAANVEGRIVPVVDLVAWCDPGQLTDVHAKGVRLLVGGNGDNAVAILFTGLPRLVQISRDDMAPGVDRLAPFVLGHDVEQHGTRAIDANRLVDNLIQELALR